MANIVPYYCVIFIISYAILIIFIIHIIYLIKKATLHYYGYHSFLIICVALKRAVVCPIIAGYDLSTWR